MTAFVSWYMSVCQINGWREAMTFDEWVEEGISQGWVSPFVCEIHDGVPMSYEEEFAMQNGEEPCIWVMRRYASKEEKLAVEDFSPHALWRNPFTLKGVD
jgi:hypothetical protein